jgi:predicted metal-dependent hydrolase
MAKARGATVMQGGRAKAYRPIAETARREAVLAGLEAYDRGDFFLAHELLEPAWMGTRNVGERELYQGLIKVAAAFVHAVRGNPRGIRKNLHGAREHLALALAAGATAGGVDLADLLDAVDDRLRQIADDPDHATIDPVDLRRRQS